MSFKACKHLNVKSIFTMSINGYKSCRILISAIITVPMAECLAYFPFDSYIPGSSCIGRNFIFQKIS